MHATLALVIARLSITSGFSMPGMTQTVQSLEEIFRPNYEGDGPSGEEAYSVVLMRHGESSFNDPVGGARFTGWYDAPLTAHGRLEARRAGKSLAAQGLTFDVAFCSFLQRSSDSCKYLLQSGGVLDAEISPRWQLNERHYGNLQGLSKSELVMELGRGAVSDLRSKYDSRPPAMEENHPHYDLMANDPRYKGLVERGEMVIPRSESLADTADRVMSVWHGEVEPLVESGKKVVIVAHRNTLRSLIRNLEGLDDEQVRKLDIPTGVPFKYPLDKKLRPVAPRLYCDTASGFKGVLLSDKIAKRPKALRERVNFTKDLLWT